MEKIAFITGSTSGIGEATAWKFAAEGWHVIISGRRIEKLNTLAARIQEKHQVAVLPLCFDITQLEEVKNSIHSLSGKWKNIGVLVNNAGLAVGRSPLQEGLYEDWDRMIDTNMKGLLYVTREIVPLFIANKKGHIINIGSLAGHEYYGGGNVYCGTKHAVKAITRSMRIDLLKEGIKVSAVSPGAVETEFSVVRYKGNKEMADKTYDGFEPLKAEDVAESIYFIANQPKHVNIEEILVLPTAQASTSIIFKQ
ncbi:MAG: SDR family NAD(P)-dependent oxidoreductase [Bacteroidetes bacterium]|jgi:3-hydroxy acid dehydrogenase/malonic semialdehyde reductase|nr:SDR family NAD(P)-dependent oxidoreductase [Bacteroidota bacterium]MBP7256831.1 SDR family NAD(P)-dependent oxidoreductase [Chitinophagales bacterium]MBK7140103.1 SDR family NAD(P)-dependent oxidoreductase [Bacteroidota bacterium]MBK7503793.1 SDR family NAD(P)-dependent oxidoreductase [Bacteroidota bacterium]MBK7640552.1 SDR family NAD(P)-dependent oxidoreductase [Bacteroidota bacterium]